jgi:hypothetical protein
VAGAGDATVYEIAPEIVPPSRDVLTARASLDAFATTYHRFLAAIERDHPECEQIELFAASPASAAVQLGRGIMRHVQPSLAVYDRRSDGSFDLALTLAERAVSFSGTHHARSLVGPRSPVSAA